MTHTNRPLTHGSSQLRVSVVIPCRNDAEFLQHALLDLEKQTLLPGEVIVVDNDSADQSAAIAKAHGVTLVHEKTHGIWPAAAAGFAAASGDIILRIDADTRVGETWLEQAVTYFTEHPEVDFIVGPGVFYGGGYVKNWLGTHCFIGLMTPALWPILGHPPLYGSNMGFRRSAWQEVATLAHTDSATIHDDLDLSFCVRPWMQVKFLPDWKAGVSARPFATWKGLGRRLNWVGTTWAANWPESKPFKHRHDRKQWRKQNRQNAAKNPATNPPETSR